MSISPWLWAGLAVWIIGSTAEAAKERPLPVVTRWMDPLGGPKPSHEAPACTGSLAGRLITDAKLMGASSGSNRVCLVVHSNVLVAISNKLESYRQALCLDGWTPVVYRYDSGSAESLRSYLAGLYAASNSLAGAVLIGAIPYALYEMMDDFGYGDDGYEDFPCDLFYMDLDGSWHDLDNELPYAEGKYDARSGNLDLEIWVSRMKADNLSSLGPEIPLLNAYFDKDLAYRAGRLRPDRRALVFIDDDWADYGGEDVEQVGRLYGAGNVVSVINPSATVMTNYLSRLSNSYELVFVKSHGYPLGHSFTNPSVGFEWVYCRNYREQTPPALMYSFFVCSGSDYSSDGYLAGAAAFNLTNAGLVCWGSAKTGGMLYDEEFYKPLAQGQSIGGAFVQWFNELQSWGYFWMPSWTYGMVVIGDGTLRLNRTDPTPSGLEVSTQAAVSEWATLPGGCYRLQACSDLAHPAWSPCGGAITASAYGVSLADTNGPEGVRTYRLIKDESGPTNLLRNAGFEAPGNTDSDAYHWTAGLPDSYAGKWGNAARESWRAREGEWEGVVKTTWGGTHENFGGFWQESAVNALTTYQASAWFWADNTWTAAVQEFKVEFYSFGSCISTSRLLLNDVHAAWTQKAFTATAPVSANAAHVVVNVSGAGGSGSLQFDAVELKRVP
ncbi:MAG: hypothetical protein A2X46_09440 [Lentisphaerae bacterium GWF2_57_35]|nr:MAG: hypothetical protein A2X46_09440 [Lentisphaerae bacterium GWF2_57_35]